MPGNMKYFKLPFAALHTGVPVCVLYLILALAAKSGAVHTGLLIGAGFMMFVIICCISTRLLPCNGWGRWCLQGCPALRPGLRIGVGVSV